MLQMNILLFNVILLRYLLFQFLYVFDTGVFSMQKVFTTRTRTELPYSLNLNHTFLARVILLYLIIIPVFYDPRRAGVQVASHYSIAALVVGWIVLFASYIPLVCYRWEGGGLVMDSMVSLKLYDVREWVWGISWDCSGRREFCINGCISSFCL